MNDKVIVIVGFMGCGKTTVSKHLARSLNKPFIDLDARIAQFDGRSPAQIISEDGESEFREKETTILRELLGSDERAVVALGGGAWTIAVNRELIRAFEAVAVWLDAPFDLCWERIELDCKSRPMAPSRPAAERLFSERLPFYRLADINVPVADASPKQIAENICALLQRQSYSK
jgi:shikimate kinase